MKWWVILSILGLLLIPASAQDDLPTYAVPLTVETVNVEITQSASPQVTLQVWGYIENACDFPIESQQDQSGRVIYVRLYIIMPPNVRCAVQERIQHTITINLNGTFEKGIVYRVDVNSIVQLEFDPEQGIVPLTNLPQRDYSQVEQVTATITNTSPLQIQFTVDGAHNDGCGAPLWVSQSVQNTNGEQHAVIELYRELPANINCAEITQGFEETILIEPLSDVGDLFVEINDAAYKVTIPEAPTTGELRLVPLRRTPVFVERILIETTFDYPAEVYAQVSGIMGETCPEAVLLWQQTTYSRGVLVNLYTLVEKEQTCPLTIAPTSFEVTIPLEGAYNDGEYQVRVNDLAQWFRVRTSSPTATPTPIIMPPPPPPPTTRVYHLIEQVDAVIFESYPYQIQLHIVGQQPDGCVQPVIVEQRRSGNNVSVEIYREMPLDIACPMVLVPYEANIMLDGGFETGHYRIRVNDYVLQIDL